MKRRLLSIIMTAIMAVTSILTGCSAGGGKNKENDLIIYCSHSDSFSKDIVDKFEEKTNINVYVVQSGTGVLLERIEKEKDKPVADLIWGGSLSILEPYKNYFEPYKSENEEKIYDDYKNSDGLITRFSVVPSVFIINEKKLSGVKVESFADLLNPELKGKIIEADPEKSSSAYEHLINQLYAMGNGNPDNGWEYIKKLNKNIDGNIIKSSSKVYSGVVNGDYAVGLTYEEPAIKYSKEDSNIKIVYPSEGTIAKADCIAILKNAQQKENAQKFVDYVTSEEVQNMLGEKNRRSVRKDVKNRNGIEDFEKINIIKDDPKWSVEKKDYILDKFKECINN